MSDAVLAWGLQFILSLQAWGHALIAPMKFFTFLGTEEFFLLLLPALYWCYAATVGLRLGVLLMLSISAVSMLKLAFHDPRPYWVDPRVMLWASGERSFGVPSSHAFDAVTIWGFLASQVRKPWAWGTAIFLMFAIGSSRVLLGLHYPTDVAVGWLGGLVLLAAFLALEAPRAAWLKRLPPIRQLDLVLAFSLVLILVGMLLRNAAQTSPIPAAWVQNALAAEPGEPINPLSLEGIINSAAVLLGLGAGVIWLHPRGGFSASGPWLHRLGRYLLGMVGAVLIWRGLDVVFSLLAPDETLLGLSLRYIRYALLGGWVSGVGPWVFIRLRLARPA